MDMEENQNPDTEAPVNEEEEIFTVTDSVSGQRINFGPGMAGTVSAGEDITISKGGALVVSVGRDAAIEEGGAMAIPVGRDLRLSNGGAMIMPIGGNAEIVNGGASLMPIGGNLEMTNGGAGVMMSDQVTARNSFLGVVISGNVSLEEGSKILLDTKRAAAFGAAFGAVFALLSLLFRRKS
jgi:hypothetical protein